MERTHKYFCHLSPLHSTATSRREFPDSPVERLVKKLWIHLLQIWASLWRPCSKLKLKEQVFFHKVWLSFCQPPKCPEKNHRKAPVLLETLLTPRRLPKKKKKKHGCWWWFSPQKRLCKAYSPILNLPLSEIKFAVMTSFPYEKKKNSKSFSPSPYTPQLGWLAITGGEWFVI